MAEEDTARAGVGSVCPVGTACADFPRVRMVGTVAGTAVVSLEALGPLTVLLLSLGIRSLCLHQPRTPAHLLATTVQAVHTGLRTGLLGTEQLAAMAGSVVRRMDL